MRWKEDIEAEREGSRGIKPEELGKGEFRSLKDLVEKDRKEAAATEPSNPMPVDRWKPTDENLWKLVLEVASGDRLKYERNGREINAPNGSRGYRNMPSNPKGIAWAVKQYKGFGGNFKGQRKQEPKLR